MNSISRNLTEILNEIVEEYSNDERFILNETDLTFKIRRKIQNRRIEDTSVHCELRPTKRNTTTEVIRLQYDEKRWIARWGQKRGSAGALFDLCLVDTTGEFWLTLPETFRKQKHWRISDYPHEDIVAVIEVKVRVNGILPKIRKDIEKLRFLCSENPRCQGFLILLDKHATHENLTEIAGYANEIPVFRNDV